MIKILGRGSKKESSKESASLEAKDPKFAHLNDDLHVEISAFATPVEAYSRMAHAISEVIYTYHMNLILNTCFFY